MSEVVVMVWAWAGAGSLMLKVCLIEVPEISLIIFPAIDLQKKDNIPWIFCRTDMKKFDDKWK